MKKIIFIFSAVFSLFIFTDNVLAESLGEKFTNFVVSGFEFIVGNGFTGVKDFADYDDRLSLFDGLENNIPVCDNSYGNYCNSGTVPSIKKLIEDYPYLIRFKVIDNITSNSYYIFGFYENENDILDTSCWGDGSTCLPIIDSPNFTISMLPTADKDNSFYSALHSSPYVLGTFHPSNPNYNLSYVPFSTSRDTSGAGYTWRYLYTKVNNKYSIELDTNFELKSENLNSNFISGPTFDTDMDITIKPGYYLRLFPKPTSSFSSYFLSDNNFLYNYSIYESDSNTIISSNQYGKLTQINFGSLGKYPWINWSFEFTNEDILSNKFLELYNSNENVDLHIKFFSNDFYYYLLDANSSCTSVNGMCIPNNYNNLYILDNSLGEVKNTYDNGDYDSGLSFIKEIPNMIKDFTKSFAFIGTLFVSFFSIFTGSIANYFYIIFGLMIIMLIIRVLK